MIVFTPGMDSAPKDRRILALWADGDIQVCRWESDQYNRRGAKPYWSIPCYGGISVRDQRAHPPIAWCELKATPVVPEKTHLRSPGTTETVMVSGAAFKRLELAVEALKQLHKSFNHSGQPIDWTAQVKYLDQIKVAAQELVERGAQ